jgi:hypothetical protein
MAVGLVALSLGEAIDLRWHLTHDEFETAGQQVRAHWLNWLAALGVLAVAVAALRRGVKDIGYRLVAVTAVVYAGLSVWHFAAHANGSDPPTAHVLIAIDKVVLFTGAVLVVAALLRRTPDPS